MTFDYNQNFKSIDFRNQPQRYQVGIGEQGVLLVEPYKSELLSLWKFRTPELAQASANKLVQAFKRYLKEGDFAGMDMARKFLQMGYNRSRRYANHRSGKKYDGPVPKRLRGKSGAHGRNILKRDIDPIKAKSAAIFYKAWQQVESNKTYRELKREWKLWYG